MNAQFKLASTREFWVGVGATLVVTVLVIVGAPSLLQSHFALYESKRVSSPGIARFSTTLASGAEADNEQKVIRTATMELLVKNPQRTSEQIRQLAEQVGGFLVSSETNGGENASNASLTVRVPVTKFEQFRSQVSKLGLQVENEKLEAQDVTKQYIDSGARLRNFARRSSNIWEF